MSFLDSLRAAFKGGGGPRVPLARSYVSPWSYPLWACEPAGARLPFEYRSAVERGFIEATSAGRHLLETLAAQLLLHGQDIRFRDGWHRPVTPSEPMGGATVDSEARAAIAGLVEVLIAAGILAQG